MDRLFWYPGYDVPLQDIVRAENCHLYDAEGRRYVDLESGVWCTSVGHGHPRILRVLCEQAARIAHTGFSYSCDIVQVSARKILELHGFEGGRCIFLCSGSEAVEFGVRLVRFVKTRPLLMIMADSYCGAYGSANTRHPDEWFSFDWTVCRACPETVSCDESCSHRADVPFSKIGGFLFEPGSSSGLVRFPPKKLIQGIVSTVRAEGGFVMVNEVTTGIGRTGTWFGYQHYGIAPDIVAMGKGIGNGYPVSATVVSPGVAQILGKRQVKYAQSHQNDALGAAIALEVIRTIQEEGLIERGRRIADRLLKGLEAVQARTGRIKAIRARGLMVAVELDDNADAAFTARVRTALVREGFILAQRPGLSILRIDPGLTIDHEDMDTFLDALERVLMGTEAEV